MIGTVIVVPIITVACSSTDEQNSSPPVNNRPTKGFYYKYEAADMSLMAEFIRYVYDNNPVKDRYLANGWYWPSITNIKIPSSPNASSKIPDEVFLQEMNEPIESYANEYRNWAFEIEFNNGVLDGAGNKVSALIYDHLFSYTSEKYNNLKNFSLIETSADTTYASSWIRANSNNWNTKYKYANSYPLSSIIGSVSYSSYLDYPKLPYGIRNVDLWYLTKQYRTSWPKPQKEYWKDYAYAIGLEDGDGTKWYNTKPLNV